VFAARESRNKRHDAKAQTRNQYADIDSLIKHELPFCLRPAKDIVDAPHTRQETKQAGVVDFDASALVPQNHKPARKLHAPENQAEPPQRRRHENRSQMTQENHQAWKTEHCYRQSTSLLEPYRNEFDQNKGVKVVAESQSERQADAIDKRQGAPNAAEADQQPLHFSEI